MPLWWTFSRDAQGRCRWHAAEAKDWFMARHVLSLGLGREVTDHQRGFVWRTMVKSARANIKAGTELLASIREFSRTDTPGADAPSPAPYTKP